MNKRTVNGSVVIPWQNEEAIADIKKTLTSCSRPYSIAQGTIDYVRNVGLVISNQESFCWEDLRHILESAAARYGVSAEFAFRTDFTVNSFVSYSESMLTWMGGTVWIDRQVPQQLPGVAALCYYIVNNKIPDESLELVYDRIVDNIRNEYAIASNAIRRQILSALALAKNEEFGCFANALDRISVTDEAEIKANYSQLILHFLGAENV